MAQNNWAGNCDCVLNTTPFNSCAMILPKSKFQYSMQIVMYFSAQTGFSKFFLSQNGIWRIWGYELVLHSIFPFKGSCFICLCDFQNRFDGWHRMRFLSFPKGTNDFYQPIATLPHLLPFFHYLISCWNLI